MDKKRIYYNRVEDTEGAFLWFNIYTRNCLYSEGDAFEEDGKRYKVVSHVLDEKIESETDIIYILFMKVVDLKGKGNERVDGRGRGTKNDLCSA